MQRISNRAALTCISTVQPKSLSHIQPLERLVVYGTKRAQVGEGDAEQPAYKPR